jgi:phage terminase large subunit-like protein
VCHQHVVSQVAGDVFAVTGHFCPILQKLANLTHLGERLGGTKLARQELETSLPDLPAPDGGTWDDQDLSAEWVTSLQRVRVPGVAAPPNIVRPR